jgi:hypothetical protein
MLAIDLGGSFVLDASVLIGHLLRAVRLEDAVLHEMKTLKEKLAAEI